MKLSVSPEILALLVCPVTGQPLHLATQEELATWHAAETFEGALISSDGSHAYPIREGFPVLVAGEALRKEG
ncbi:MAG: Trm112 family protein [Verrucomicrobiales bacterium]